MTFLFKTANMTHLNVGDKVPNFSTVDQSETVVSNKSLIGTKYILFFYPKDDSPGCTKEACAIRDSYKKISKAGYQVFGVSPDNVKKHNKFIDKYEFQYSLLADVDKEMINAFGLWGPKKFMGREVIGVHRTTFIVNEKGVIEHIILKVKTKEHDKQILDLVA